MSEKISFVIPCYGSENTIQGVVYDIHKLMNSHREFEHEIILINDCSPDNVWSVIEQIVSSDELVTGINLAQNFGQHAALMAGYNYCSGDYVVTLDDDGQTPVGETFILIDELLDREYDVVYAKYQQRKDNIFRKFGTCMNNLMSESLLGKPKNVHLTSFFVAKKYIINEIIKYPHSFPYIWGLVLRTTKNIGNAMIQHENRKDGQSGYTLKKLLSLWLNGFTAFSVKPLRLTAGVGVLFSGIGVLGVIYTVITKLIDPGIAAGYSSLMAVLLIVGGLTLLSLGLIGEYVGRIYMCINHTPQYVIKSIEHKEEFVNLENQC